MQSSLQAEHLPDTGVANFARMGQAGAGHDLVFPVERERAVNQAIRHLALTRVIVAHRPETIQSAGRVVALHEGRVAQDLRSVPGAAPLQ